MSFINFVRFGKHADCPGDQGEGRGGHVVEGEVNYYGAENVQIFILTNIVHIIWSTFMVIYV